MKKILLMIIILIFSMNLYSNDSKAEYDKLMKRFKNDVNKVYVFAKIKDNKEHFKMLINDGLKIKYRKENRVFHFIVKEYYDLALQMINKSNINNYYESFGSKITILNFSTPIFKKCDDARFNFIKKLIDLGADINKPEIRKNGDKIYCLDKAIRSKSDNLVELYRELKSKKSNFYVNYKKKKKLMEIQREKKLKLEAENQKKKMVEKRMKNIDHYIANILNENKRKALFKEYELSNIMLKKDIKQLERNLEFYNSFDKILNMVKQIKKRNVAKEMKYFKNMELTYNSLLKNIDFNYIYFAILHSGLTHKEKQKYLKDYHKLVKKISEVAEEFKN